MADTKIIYIADDDDNIRQVIRTFLLSDAQGRYLSAIYGGV